MPAVALRAPGRLASALGAQHALGSVPAGAKSEPIVALRVEMQTLLKTYDETCNKYLGSPSAVRTIAEIEDEMEQLRKELERY